MDLSAFFQAHPAGAVAFSGGTDSALLVWAAGRYGRDWRAYYAKSPFQPAFELEDAWRIAGQCGVPLTVLEIDLSQKAAILSNPPERCYHCKRLLFSRILCQARTDGYALVIDGTNASDQAGDRPGMRALEELQVRSPLRECGLTKEEVRHLSRQAGLPTWDKPAYACLATRIPTGTAITPALLEKVEQGESFLATLGFRDFRLRLRAEGALLQVTAKQLPLAAERQREIGERLTPLLGEIQLDPEPRTPSV